MTGQGPGEIAAAQAVGMLGLEDGLRLAVARGRLHGDLPRVSPQAAALADLQETLAAVEIAPAALAFVSGTTGRTLRPGDAPESEYWQQQAVEPLDLGVAVAALAEFEVDTIVEIGPNAALGPAIREAWPRAVGRGTPSVVASLLRPTAEAAADDVGFAAAAAQAFEAGIPLRFEGLFAGEARRRISLPGYPFQRRRFWIDTAPR